MADPLSVTAGVVGILGFGIQACQLLIDFYSSARGSREDVRALCESTEALSRMLTVLQNVIGQQGVDTAATAGVRNHIMACRAGLARLDKKLRKIQNVRGDGGMRALYLAMQYPLKENTILKLRTIIAKELMGQLSLALGTLNLETSISIIDGMAQGQSITNDSINRLLAETRAIQNTMLESNLAATQNIDNLRNETRAGFQGLDKDLNDIAAMTLAMNAENIRGDVLNWISCSDIIGSSHNSACKQRQEGTGNWFIHGKTYEGWKTEQGSFIWLHGIPGCGKTILCSSIIEETLKYCSSRQNHYVAYFYITFNDSEKQRPENIVRSLLHQLTSRQSSMPDILLDLYRQHKNTAPPINVWLAALRSVLDRSGEMFIIIDALDECPVRMGEREELLKGLVSIKDFKLPNLHLLVTSRREVDISKTLSHILTEPPFGIQNSEVDQDIQIHVRSEVTNNPKLSKWPHSIREEIEKELVHGCHGMFRWVTCQLDSLKGCLRASAVRSTLKALPPTLDATYERILLNIGTEYRKEAISALMWLMASERPVYLNELAEAAVIDISVDQPFDPEDRLFDPQSILAVLSALVSVVPDDEDEDEEDSKAIAELLPLGKFTEIRLAHYSVREYLSSGRLAQTPLLAAKFYITPYAAHYHLSFSCIAYISYWALRNDHESVNPSPYWLASVAPLMVYATKYWATHALRCGSELPENLKLLIVRFLTSEKVVELWTKLFSPETEEFICAESEEFISIRSFVIDRHKRSRPLANDFISTRTQVLLAGTSDERIRVTRFFPPQLVPSHRKRDLPAPPPYYIACLGLSELVPEILKTTSINCEVGGSYDSPLQVASFKGHEQTVLALLKAGANVNASGGLFHTALEAACMAEHAFIVHHLLEAGAAVNLEYILSEMIMKRKLNAEVVIRLLKTTEYVDHRRRTFGWLMKWASWHGHSMVVRHLLQRMRGLEPNSFFHWTMPHIVGLTAISDTSYQPHGSAPYEAAVAGNLEVLQLLVPRWANINENAYEGNTALYWAALHNSKEMVGFLLARSADIHVIENFYGWTAHSWAHFNKSTEILEMLKNACKVEDCGLCLQRLSYVQ